MQGGVPLVVVATTGSTVLGSYDPINPIADICEQYNMWLHVDVSELINIMHYVRNTYFQERI